MVAAVERAVARGELPRGTNPLLVIEPIFGALLVRHATGGESDPKFASQLVDVVIAGALTGAAVDKSRT